MGAAARRSRSPRKYCKACGPFYILHYPLLLCMYPLIQHRLCCRHTQIPFHAALVDVIESLLVPVRERFGHLVLVHLPLLAAHPSRRRAKHHLKRGHAVSVYLKINHSPQKTKQKQRGLFCLGSVSWGGHQNFPGFSGSN